MYRLPGSLRSELRDPLGEVVTEDELPGRLPGGALLMAVGDMVAYTAYRLRLEPHLTIVDFQTQRDDNISFADELRTMGEAVIHVDNPAGEITKELWQAVEDALASDRSVRIEVNGEEDLAVLPCVMLAPDGSYLLYGLWDRGLVLVEINSHTRERADKVLKLMEV